MSMTERQCGITDPHIKALENTMKKENTFLFVRPTEYDSTILIKQGYATKSMDIHHKSSNWGPMAGFVPCDPAFSKKVVGDPNPTELGHKHGKASPVQLFITPALLSAHQKIREVNNFSLEAASGSPGNVSDYKKYIVKPLKGAGVSRLAAKFNAQATRGSVLEHKFVIDKEGVGGTRATPFCLIKKGGKWLVFWVEMQGDQGRLHPLNVFAYPGPNGLNPVTGDYDMWMVSPHISHMDKHGHIDAVVDAHGSSAASEYITDLIKTMNNACGQASTPVFNHGAEEQNYGFTQTLDRQLAMITPGGTSRMVDIERMPMVMADIQNAGYLVIWNKSYGEVDPKLSGQPNPEWVQFRASLDKALGALKQFQSGIDLKRQSQIADAWRSDAQHRMPQTMQEELALAVKAREARMEVKQSATPEAAIFRFHEDLARLLGVGHVQLTELQNEDFPQKFQRTNLEALNLQRSLQNAIVTATTGGGQSDRSKLDNWYRKNAEGLQTLKAAWGIA